MHHCVIDIYSCSVYFGFMVRISSFYPIILCNELSGLRHSYSLSHICELAGNWLIEAFSSVAQSCLTLSVPWTAPRQASLSITNSQSLLKLMPTESVMPSNHLILCHLLLLLPSVFPNIRVFTTESALRIKWPEYQSFSFRISPSNGYSGLISFQMDWLDLLAVQGTLKSLLQHHSSKASILQHSTFFIVQLTSIHDYWKNHSLD